MKINDIKKYHDTAIRLSTRNGLYVPSNDRKAMILLKQALFAVVYVFLDEFIKSSICAVSLYDIEKQPERYKNADAFYITHTKDNVKISAVFISSDEALLYGITYTMFLLIHELCHDILGKSGHSETFEALLNEMLAIFSKSTGIKLRNDFAGYGGTDRFRTIENQSDSETLQHWQQFYKTANSDKAEKALALTNALMGGSDHDID